MTIDSQLKEKLQQAKSLEEVKAILGKSLSPEEVERWLRELGETRAEGVMKLEDEELAEVSGGLALSGGEFNLNTWIGKLLRDWMKKDSARNADKF